MTDTHTAGLTGERWGFSPQEGVPGDCAVAQVWNAEGLTLAEIEPTENPAAATAMAQMFASAPAMLEALINAERALSDYACRDPDKKGVPCIRLPSECAAECGDVASIALGWTRAAIALATGETK